MEPLELFSLIQPLVEKTINDRVAAKLKEAQYNVAKIPAHHHDGTDSLQIQFTNVQNRLLFIPWTLSGTSPATAANYGTFFIAPVASTIRAIQEIHQTAGSDAGAVTLDIEKLTSTTAAGSGVSTLLSTLSLKAVANTLQTASLTQTAANLQLAAGDRLALKLSGTPTAVATLSVIVTLQF